MADIDGVYLVFDFHVGDDGEQKRDFVLVKSERKEEILRINYSFSDTIYKIWKDKKKSFDIGIILKNNKILFYYIFK